jgi:transposase, IS6 family
MKRRRRPRVVVVPSAFSGFRFPPEVIMLAVRWYLGYGLSYRDVDELLAERGVEVDHVTLYRWVQRLAVVCTRECTRLCGNLPTGQTDHWNERVLRCNEISGASFVAVSRALRSNACWS